MKRNALPLRTERKIRHQAWRITVTLIWLAQASLCAVADPARVAVFYPEVSGAYSSVFQAILDGIAATPGVRMDPLALGRGQAAAEVQRWLDRQQAGAVIALGKRSYDMVQQLIPDLPVLVGALLIEPNGVSGISLAGDPEEFFQRVRSLTPRVNRVFVVYSRKNNGWLIPRASKAANNRGLELVTVEAKNARAAVHAYREILGRMHESTDALWLPLDSVVADDTILPMILEAAWSRRLVVFSNNIEHAKQGALFALYPDYRKLGSSLAGLALRLAAPPSAPETVLPTRDLRLAVNVRTASHLGLRFSNRQQEHFDLIFPLTQ
jgi:putative ABC transport system substrate-binding protein